MGANGTVTVSTKSTEGGVLTLEYSATEGTVWYGMQLFYKCTQLPEGVKYTLTLKINSTVAGDITVNGKVIALVVGDNAITVDYNEPVNKSSVSIQFGKEGTGMILSGKFIISDVVVSPATDDGGDAPVEGGDDNPSEGAETVELTFVEFYGDHYFHFRAVSTYDMTNIDYVRVNGTQRACEVTDNANGNYTLKMYVADQVVAGEYTFEWVKDGKVVATATYTYAG